MYTYISIFIVLLIFIIYYILYQKYTGLFIDFKQINNEIKLCDSYKLLTKKRCKSIEKKILNLKKYWKSELIFGLCNNLGLSCKNCNENLSNKNNEFMMIHFNRFYYNLLKKLERRLNASVEYKKKGFLPGFSIQSKHFLSSYNLFPFRKNTEYNKCDWKDYSKCDFNNQLSFVVPINVSDKDGIYIFNTDTTMNKNEAVKCNKQRYNYKLGEIVLYNSNYWNIKSIHNNSSEYTILLHGNIVKCDETWVIYY